MQISTHLTFAGQCAEAFRFYERVIPGSKLYLFTYGESPMANDVAPELRDRVVHATLTIGAQTLAGADVPADEHERPQGFYVLLTVEDYADAKRIFAALAVEGTVRMPLQKTFWSPGFGALVDRFGVPWEVSCAQK